MVHIFLKHLFIDLIYIHCRCKCFLNCQLNITIILLKKFDFSHIWVLCRQCKFFYTDNIWKLISSFIWFTVFWLSHSLQNFQIWLQWWSDLFWCTLLLVGKVSYSLLLYISRSSLSSNHKHQTAFCMTGLRIISFTHETFLGFICYCNI